MTCKIPNCESPVENLQTGLCSSHARESRKEKKIKKPTKIRQISKKQARKNASYSKVKELFFQDPRNRICAVCGMPAVDSIHHAKGRLGYADDWARQNEIELLIDTRFFIPVHSFNVHPEYGVSCHSYIEVNPEFARKNNFTKSRLNKE